MRKKIHISYYIILIQNKICETSQLDIGYGCGTFSLSRALHQQLAVFPEGTDHNLLEHEHSLQECHPSLQEHGTSMRAKFTSRDVDFTEDFYGT